MTNTVFSKLSDDVVLNIFSKLEDDPRNWARLACVCTRFSSLIRNVCWRHKCSATIPSVVSDLISSTTSSSSPPGGWAALHKLAVCCPGLRHSGVLLEHSDFGLERELGPDEIFRSIPISIPIPIPPSTADPCPSHHIDDATSVAEPSWSLFDDLYYDTVYNNSDTQDGAQVVDEEVAAEKNGVGVVEEEQELPVSKRRKIDRLMRSHLASGVWNLSREQGSKLLARQFRDDCLYICDWPGCVHIEDKRNYMLFRGIFKNFRRTRVWRTINDGNRSKVDGNRSKVDVNCAFCASNETWDLHSAFCLRRVFGYHDDGEPVVRAYVCENGHVSGAWTDLPLYT